MHSWLKAMGLNSGGKGYEAVREQSRRLSLCRLTFYRLGEGGEAVLNGGFVREAILPGKGGGEGRGEGEGEKGDEVQVEAASWMKKTR